MECVLDGIIEAKREFTLNAIVTSSDCGEFGIVFDQTSWLALTSFVGAHTLLLLMRWHVDALEVLLQGLCGGLRETIKVHEICLKTGPNLGAVASEVHLCCSLSQPEPVWSVRHVGGAMRGAGAEQLPALVRPVLEAGISNNALRFLYALGYKLDYELLRTGFSFQMHKTVPIAVIITISVTAVHKLPRTYAIDEAQPVTPNLHMVQLTAPASPDNYFDVVGALSGLAEHLAPLVHLSKPGVPAGVVPTASTAAAALVSRGGITKVL